MKSEKFSGHESPFWRRLIDRIDGPIGPTPEESLTVSVANIHRKLIDEHGLDPQAARVMTEFAVNEVAHALLYVGVNTAPEGKEDMRNNLGAIITAGFELNAPKPN